MFEADVVGFAARLKVVGHFLFVGICFQSWDSVVKNVFFCAEAKFYGRLFSHLCSQVTSIKPRIPTTMVK